MHDLKPLCPCYTMLSHGNICEKCASGSYWTCIKNKCMKDSISKSILAAIESEVYRLNKTYQKLDLIITPSDFYRRKLYSSGITNTAIVHMPNFLVEPIDGNSEVCVGDYFLYFGRLSKEKGVLTLLNAYKQANAEHQLFIVGTGPLEMEIRYAIRKLNLETSVKLLGFKSGTELKRIVKKSRCVILPSEWYENGPYSIIEALAVGKPCIVSNNGGLPEIIIHNENGFIFESGDINSFADKISCIDKLASIELSSMGYRSKELAKELADSERYLTKLELYYQQLLN